MNIANDSFSADGFGVSVITSIGAANFCQVIALGRANSRRPSAVSPRHAAEAGVTDVFFTDFVLPADAVVGQVDQGWRQLMAGLNLIERARLLVYRTATLVDRSPGTVLPRETSMAKLKATETARRFTLDAMQMMGGYGYATEFTMERLVRSAVVSTVYGGTSEIQRDIIGKTYGLAEVNA